MIIEPFRIGDITSFLKLAAAEGWVAEPWEFEFLLAEFPQGCFTARSDNGNMAGFVTSLRHDKSGWIGNLIVDVQHRGQGIGECLFKTAFEALQYADVETYWLTASESGRSLYEKHGFSRVDTIIRWVGEGRQRRDADDGPGDLKILSSSSIANDCQAWGDRREALLAATVGRGRLLQDESGFISLQSCGDSVQIGPFSAGNTDSADLLFEKAARSVVLGTKIMLDAPVSNRSALRLYNRRSMRIVGSSELMYAGTKPEYRPELIYGLATMGSCG